jgi:heptosyltransferase-2
MPFDKSSIHKILVISLTNIGDVVLTFPVIDILKRDFSQAELSVVVGPKAAPLIQGNLHFKQIYIFDKHQPFLKTLRWIFSLRSECFDLVVDLRNTAIPFLISPRYRTSLISASRGGTHMSQKHLRRLRSVYPYGLGSDKKYALQILEETQRSADEILRTKIGQDQRYVVIAPGAADQAKRWTERGFAEVCYHLMKRHYMGIVIVGDEKDGSMAQRVYEVLQEDAVVNLCGQTTLAQLAAILERCSLAIVNDSAPMHMASYLDVPVLALFGPTDAVQYGPWGTKGFYVQKNQSCPACRKPAESARHTCMTAIRTQDVLSCFQVVNNGIVFLKS